MLKNVELYHYQRNQFNFIRDKLAVSDRVAVESGTGSGKTIVMLKFAEYWMSLPENKLSNVVISTGMNNLVYLMEKRALEMGMKPKVLIGVKACNCPRLMENDDVEFKVFTQGNTHNCGTQHYDLSQDGNNCPYTVNAYREYYNGITNGVGQLIITNHSSLLVHQSNLNASLVLVDEAHTFSVFYDSFLQLELDKNDLKGLDEAIMKTKKPMSSIIKMNLNRGAYLPRQQVEKICEKIEENEILKNKVAEFFYTKPSPARYLEYGEDSFTLDKFYKHFDLDINPKMVLFSATMDTFTMRMFQIRESDFYREPEVFCDYSQSEFIAIPREDFKQSLLAFINYVDDQHLQSGLILSTTMTDVRIAMRQDGYRDFTFFDDLMEFQRFKGKRILVGSRALFQGIDIQGLDFVALNKIPFPNYNDKFKALQSFLTDNGTNDFDSWNDFTVIKAENDLIQTTGRLWRSKDSKGIVSIFDPRVEKFTYMMRHVFNGYRHGIVSKIMDESCNVKDYPLSKDW